MSDSGVIRYIGDCDGYKAPMLEDSKGEYVLYEDYKDIKKKLDDCVEVLELIHRVNEESSLKTMLEMIEDVLDGM